MDWKLQFVEQETQHKFLNFYTFHYEVDGAPYSYFVASRNDKEHLLSLTRNYQRPDGVLIVALKDEGENCSVLMIEEFRPAANAVVLEFPAGLLDPQDESVEQTAIRESLEEAGVVLKDVRLLCPPSPTSIGLSDEMLAVVEGKVDSTCDAHKERFEDINARFVPLRDVRALLDDPHRLIALNVRLCLEILLERYAEPLQLKK